MKTDLYRHFSRTGKLLYVGISYSAFVRLSQHSDNSHWFDKIKIVKIQKFNSREEALIAEKIAIEKEKPLYNIMFSKNPPVFIPKINKVKTHIERKEKIRPPPPLKKTIVNKIQCFPVKQHHSEQWTFYKSAKKNLINGIIDLDGKFFIALYTSLSNVHDINLQSIDNITNPVSECFGYELKSLNTNVITNEESMMFNAQVICWTAYGGNISNVQYAVIFSEKKYLLCHSKLSDEPFSVTSGNTLTISPSANGIFELD